jgi:DedD protein
VEKAVELKSRVESLGLSSYTDRSGALTRLRVGPFNSREAAAEAAERLSENGVPGKVMPK